MSSAQVVNVASVPQRSPFRYPGGKTWLVPQIRRWLLSLKTPPFLLVEPFAGGGIVSLTAAFEQLARGVLLAELDQDVAAVWQAVLDASCIEPLIERIMTFTFSVEGVESLLLREPRTLLDRAFATLVRNRAQHGGILAPGASLMRKGEAGRGIGSRWYPATIARRLREIHARRNRIAFRLGDAFEVIQEHTGTPGVAFFIDPPYTLAGRRLYRHCDVDHRRLFHLMQEVTGEFLMTYDHTPEVAAWAAESGFDALPIPMKSRQHAHKTELLIGRRLGWAR